MKKFLLSASILLALPVLGVENNDPSNERSRVLANLEEDSRQAFHRILRQPELAWKNLMNLKNPGCDASNSNKRLFMEKVLNLAYWVDSFLSSEPQEFSDDMNLLSENRQLVEDIKSEIKNYTGDKDISVFAMDMLSTYNRNTNKKNQKKEHRLKAEKAFNMVHETLKKMGEDKKIDEFLKNLNNLYCKKSIDEISDEEIHKALSIRLDRCTEKLFSMGINGTDAEIIEARNDQEKVSKEMDELLMKQDSKMRVIESALNKLSKK